DEVDLTLQLLDLRAHVAERRVDLQRLIDGLRLREELEVTLLLGLLRDEPRLQIGELVGDVLRVDVRGDHLAVEQLQLAERLIEAVRRDANADQRAAVLALTGLAHGEDVAAETVRDGAGLVRGRPRILRLHRDVRGEDEIAARVRDDRRAGPELGRRDGVRRALGRVDGGLVGAAEGGPSAGRRWR